MKKVLLSIFLILNITVAYAKVNVIVSIPPQQSYKNQNSDMEIFDSSTNIERIDMKFTKKSKRITSIQKPRKDLHVWTTPKNIAIIGKNIYETLVKHDSTNKEQYKKNYEAFLLKTQKTDAQIKAILKDVEKDAKFMVYHPAWGYFSKEYHLEQMPIEKEGKEPKPRELQKMIEKGKKYKVKAILTQPEFSTKGANLIANELDIKVVEISPIAPKWSENLIKLANTIAKNN